MKKILLSSIVAVAMLSSSLYGVENSAVESKDVSSQAVATAKDSANVHKNDIKIIKEAVEAVNLTQA